MIVVDYTLPSAVNENATFYCENSLPFVMGTTGGDREKLIADVAASGNYAVIAPNMGKQIVAFQVGSGLEVGARGARTWRKGGQKTPLPEARAARTRAVAVQHRAPPWHPRSTAGCAVAGGTTACLGGCQGSRQPMAALARR